MTTVAQRIDPELAQALGALPKTAAGIFDLNDLAGTRAAIHDMADVANAAAAADSWGSSETLEAQYGDGPPVAIRLHRPDAGSAPEPALLWFHGGGQVLGYAAQDDAATIQPTSVQRRLSAASSCAA